MSIEACPFLRPSLKAKIQDSGLLFVEDLLSLFEQKNPSAARGQQPLEKVTPVADHPTSANLPSPRTVAQGPPSSSASQSGYLLRCNDELEAALRKRLPNLSREELFDVIGSTTAYLASRESNHAPLHKGQSRAAEAEAAAPMASGPSPFFQIRTLGEIEDEVNAPSRQKPERRRGPTHATTFCRSLDTMLGAPDRCVYHHNGSSPAVKPGGKGVEVGKVTELSGPPGVGKTQLLLQLAVSAAMPVELGGLAGDCLFIDTEGSFVVERFHEIALAAVALVRDLGRREALRLSTQSNLAGHADASAVQESSPTEEAPRVSERQGVRKERRQKSSRSVLAHRSTSGSTLCSSPQPTPLKRLAESFTLSSVLSRIHYVRVSDTAAFMAVLYSLPEWIAQMKASTHRGENVETGDPARGSGADFTLKMVIVDSIAGPFRTVGTASSGGQPEAPSDLTTLRQRGRLLFVCGERLQSYAATFNMAVVVSNQVTSKMARRPSSMRNGASAGEPPFRKRRFEGRKAKPPNGSSRGGGEDEASEKTTSDNDDGNDDLSDGDGRRGSALRGSARTSGNDDLYTYLVPALGDSWATHVATRLLLSNHHYALPYTLGGNGTTGLSRDTGAPTSHNSKDLLQRVTCPEDVVFCHQGGAPLPGAACPVPQPQQHRVARLIKHDVNPRGECCFVISRKGIRDAPH